MQANGAFGLIELRSGLEMQKLILAVGKVQRVDGIGFINNAGDNS
jgi:hypothetical protein